MSKVNKIEARTEEDEFVCDVCELVFDIEDSVKPDGKKGPMLCPKCWSKNGEVDEG